jgi:hypothetical protein
MQTAQPLRTSHRARHIALRLLRMSVLRCAAISLARAHTQVNDHASTILLLFPLHSSGAQH